jgi:transcriptional regulator with XRE-family HTH domain
MQARHYRGIDRSLLATEIPVSDLTRGGLGDFLRSRREKLPPEAVGLGGGRRRRTPGLRREEVAELAGISVDWYTRLEQGRAVSPSSSTIDALARALGLSKTDHAHLRALARDAHRRAFSREKVPDALRHLVESLDRPAYIIGQRWDVLAWNAAAVDIFTDFERLAEEDRNILVYMLLDPDARRLFGPGWASEARRMLAEFRVTHDLWSGDPAFVDLLQRLWQESREFAMWWEAHDIRGVAAGQKLLNHPRKGLLRFEHASFQANDDPALKLVIYTPA